MINAMLSLSDVPCMEIWWHRGSDSFRPSTLSSTSMHLDWFMECSQHHSPSLPSRSCHVLLPASETIHSS